MKALFINALFIIMIIVGIVYIASGLDGLTYRAHSAWYASLPFIHILIGLLIIGGAVFAIYRRRRRMSGSPRG